MHERPPTDSMKEFQSKVLQVDTFLCNDTKTRKLLWGHNIFVEYNALILSRHNLASFWNICNSSQHCSNLYSRQIKRLCSTLKRSVERILYLQNCRSNLGQMHSDVYISNLFSIHNIFLWPSKKLIMHIRYT